MKTPNNDTYIKERIDLVMDNLCDIFHAKYDAGFILAVRNEVINEFIMAGYHKDCKIT